MFRDRISVVGWYEN